VLAAQQGGALDPVEAVPEGPDLPLQVRQHGGVVGGGQLGELQEVRELPLEPLDLLHPCTDPGDFLGDLAGRIGAFPEARLLHLDLEVG